MKRFRRITAITLALVVIAMLGISASAASFSRNVPGDFGVGVGAVFNGNLTTSQAWASAAFYGAQEEGIDLVYQQIVIDGQSVSQDTPYDFKRIEANQKIYDNDAVGALAPASTDYDIQYATYTYNAYYIANGVIDCYMNDGPVRLNNP